jgi:CDGSH-type Zn-finger protein
MSNAVAARKVNPVGAALRAGETRAPRACGPSAGQPFGDGSHRHTGFERGIIRAGRHGLAGRGGAGRRDQL